MVKFSHKNVLKLIKLVSEQRDLYDPDSPFYKSKNKRAKIWEEIGTKFNKKRGTGNICKNMWNKLKRRYAHFKKNGSVFTNRTCAQSIVFQSMTFSEVKKQQGNEKEPQSKENQQQGNKNQQQGNKNQQQGNTNQQQGNENQEQGNENQQQGNTNQQQGQENQEQRNKKQLCPQTTNGFLEDKEQEGIQKKSTDASTASQSVRTLQNVMPSVQLNISGVEINLGSNGNKETPQSLHENFPAPKQKPQIGPQQRHNEDKSMEDELHLFSTQVRNILVNLSRELQIKAQDEVFQVLSKYKTLAHLSTSVTESFSNNTE